MIYTVTFNPALDYTVYIDNVKSGKTNRSDSEGIFIGGKGINVSIVLNNLGIENTALGFIAGFTGDEIQNLMNKFGCKSNFIKLPDGMSRINIKIKSDTETEINASGPTIPSGKLEELLDRIDTLKSGDILVLAGSIPESIPDTIYMEIMKRLSGRDILIAVDAEKSLLLNVLEYHPFLIKPNHHELGEIFGVNITNNKDEVIEYAKKLQKKGARNVLVSMAGEGAVLATENGEVYKMNAPKGKVKNSVGAGDSMVAGFLAGWINSEDYLEAFKMGISSGSASAFSDKLADRQQIMDIYREL